MQKGCTGVILLCKQKKEGEKLWICGTGIIATLEKTTLVFIGKGKMDDTKLYENWSDEKITKVIIEEGITHIGNYAFAFCYGLFSVHIPDSIVSIGEGAFYNCSGLVSVIIPNSVEKIDNYAFEGCLGLEQIEIGENVKELGREFLCYGDKKPRHRDMTKNIIIINRSLIPQHIIDDTFLKWRNNNTEESSLNEDNNYYSSARLYVHESALNAYKNHREWGNFSIILPIPAETVECITHQIKEKEDTIKQLEEDIKELKEQRDRIQLKSF